MYLRHRQFMTYPAHKTMPLSPTTPSWPASANDSWICYAALFVFFPAMLGVRSMGLSMPWRMLLTAAVPAAVVVSLEALFLQTAKRPSTGLQFGRWAPDFTAVAFKLCGLCAIFGTIGTFYWLSSEYELQRYNDWFLLLKAVAPWGWLVAVVYVAVVDGFQPEAARREDLYHNLGRLLLRQGTLVPIPRARWAGMAREYCVKAFFLPLMTSALAGSMRIFDEKFDPLVSDLMRGQATFVQFFAWAYEMLFFVDVVWASLGYALSFKLLDSHVRSAEPTFLGWAVALCCYFPFVTSALDAYASYHSPVTWGVYFKDSPRWFFRLWGTSILVLVGIYVWATVMFGVRFSNLTNRGILTNGPYAFVRHPAYISKNLSWWLVSIPWSLHDGYASAVKRCARITMINTIYWARAMTEEAHLLQDPAYLQYYNAMQRRWGLPTLAQGVAPVSALKQFAVNGSEHRVLLAPMGDASREL